MEKAIDLAATVIQPEALAKIPVDFARRFKVMPIQIDGAGSSQTLKAAVEDPRNLDLAGAIRFRFNVELVLVKAGRDAITAAIEQHYNKKASDGGTDQPLGKGSLVDPQATIDLEAEAIPR